MFIRRTVTSLCCIIQYNSKGFQPVEMSRVSETGFQVSVQFQGSVSSLKISGCNDGSLPFHEREKQGAVFQLQDGGSTPLPRSRRFLVGMFWPNDLFFVLSIMLSCVLTLTLETKKRVIRSFHLPAVLLCCYSRR